MYLHIKGDTISVVHMLILIFINCISNGAAVDYVDDIINNMEDDNQDSKPLSDLSNQGNEDGGKTVTCFCNLPSCVTAGYLCKSPLGGCFSHMLPEGNSTMHGCIGFGDDSKSVKHKCMNSPSGSAVWAVPGNGNAGQPAAAGGSLMLCCYQDLCNGFDNPQAKLRLNDTSTYRHLGNNAAGPSDSNSTDIWFKAATIAVPICGALILFLLIALAVKLLRTDGLDASNKLSASYIPHGSGHTRLVQPLMKKSGIPMESSLTLSQPSAAALLMHTCETLPMHYKKEPSGDKCDRSDESYVIMQHYPVSQQQSSPSARDVQKIGDCANVNCNFLPPNDKLYNKETILCWGESGSNPSPR